MKLLTPYDVAALTGLPYSKALLLVKGIPHLHIEKRYYVSEATLAKYLNPSEAIEIYEVPD